MLINYGEEWQQAWDEHVKNWQPSSPESDFSNLTLWTDLSDKNNGKLGYVRAETLNKDMESPLRTIKEQMTEPYPHGVTMLCQVNPNHLAEYLFEPETVPFFKREWEEKLDDPDDMDEVHKHKCNVTDRYLADDDSEDGQEGEQKYLYTIVFDAKKRFDGQQDTIEERHEILDVPRDAIEFINTPYTSDVFLKTAFRHEMKLPDEIFPIAWMNVKDEQK